MTKGLEGMCIDCEYVDYFDKEHGVGHCTLHFIDYINVYIDGCEDKGGN